MGERGGVELRRSVLNAATARMVRKTTNGGNRGGGVQFVYTVPVSWLLNLHRLFYSFSFKISGFEIVVLDDFLLCFQP